MSKHPTQPLVTDEHGVLRFKANAIVRFLLDAGPFDMNALAEMAFSNEDRVQFAQLIGYSQSGFGDLSYVSDEDYARAEEAVPVSDRPTALQLAQEWQEVITILAADTAECLELDMEIGLKEKRGHPFWWGKVSVLRTLKALADADVRRCSPRPLEKL